MSSQPQKNTPSASSAAPGSLTPAQREAVAREVLALLRQELRKARERRGR